MKIHNHLPLLLECLQRWKNVPTERQFNKEYVEPIRESAGSFFDDFWEVLLELDWDAYRTEALTIDPDFEEKRLRQNMMKVEKLFDLQLKGDAILMGAFAAMDGYARFDRGTHQMFLGIDESHRRGRYLDILMVHELTHVARESQASVWEGFGLNPKMSQDEFTSSQPVIEHLMGEGFSCAVSEILVPGQSPWEYVFQTKASFEQIFKKGPSLDQMIRNELRQPHGNYGFLYSAKPLFAHYVWAWRWVKTLIKNHGQGDPKKILSLCSGEFMEEALAFRLA